MAGHECRAARSNVCVRLLFWIIIFYFIFYFAISIYADPHRAYTASQATAIHGNKFLYTTHKRNQTESNFI